MNNYQLRLMRAQDIDAIRDLFRRVYQSNRTIAEDNWRFTETESGLAPVILAEENGKLVGAYAMWPTRVLCNNQQVAAAQALDIMVDPAHGGKGLFTQMGKEIFDVLKGQHIKIIYGFPNPPSYGGHVHKMNWRHVCDIPRYVRFVHPLRRFNFVPEWVHSALNVIKPQSDSGFEITIEQPQAAMLEEIMSETEFPERSCRVLRDARWFQWRYNQEAELSHIWLSAKKVGVLKGFAVFRESALEGEPEKRFIRISELWGNKEVVDALLRDIVRYAYDRKCMLVMIMTNMPHLRTSLCRQWFLKLQKKPFIVRPLTTENLPANIYAPNNWYIMSGDFDAM
jgi:predicted N-acetyltransferase YhbS